MLHLAAGSTKNKGFTKAKNVSNFFIIEPERPNLLQYIFSLGESLVWIVVGVVEAILTFITRQMFGYKRQRNIDIFAAVPLEAQEGNKYILTLIMKAIVSCFLKILLKSFS